MSIENFMEPCVLMKRESFPDGHGGFFTKWVKDGEFKAAVSLNGTSEGVMAGTVSETYKILVGKDTDIGYNDVFRLNTRIFIRITSDPQSAKTPGGSKLNLKMAFGCLYEMDSDFDA